MADDDLDAFFDDVENAVKEVEETAEDGTTAATAADKTAADDDDKAPTGKDEPKDGDDEGERRPAKRTRVTAASSVPVKSIVASSVPVTSIVAPPLPPGPPPGSFTAAASSTASAIPPPPPPNSNYPNAPSASAHPHPPPLPPNPDPNNTNGDGKSHVRSAAGTTWEDPTLSQWPANDFRLFVGNLAKDLKQHHLEQHFGKYASFAMARVMYNKTDGKSRGYGFVSVLDAKDCAKAIREMDQSWLGSRPIKVKLSEWKDREWKEVKKKGKAAKRKKKHFGL